MWVKGEIFVAKEGIYRCNACWHLIFIKEKFKFWVFLVPSRKFCCYRWWIYDTLCHWHLTDIPTQLIIYLSCLINEKHQAFFPHGNILDNAKRNTNKNKSITCIIHFSSPVYRLSIYHAWASLSWTCWLPLDLTISCVSE